MDVAGDGEFHFPFPLPHFLHLPPVINPLHFGHFGGVGLLIGGISLRLGPGLSPRGVGCR